jgi:hypothetical protein
MSIHRVKIPVQTKTYQDLVRVSQQLAAGTEQNLSKVLGEVLSQLSCEVLDQVFAALIRSQADKGLSTQSSGESQQVLTQIIQQLQKYMPKSLGMLNNQRVQPVAQYILAQFDVSCAQQICLCYEVTDDSIQQAKIRYQRLMHGDEQAIAAVFADVVQIIDQGVTALIREPKAMLKFNALMDKTLNGLILLMTNLGYKRIEKIATSVELGQAQDYAKHFNLFMGIEELV